MYCLRCGRETDDDHVFCPLCQENMEQYPVKPGTPIHLPHRETAVAAKKKFRRKKSPTPEEQVVSLKRSLRRTRRFTVALILLFALVIGVVCWYLQQEQPNIGKNYNVDTTQQTN